MSVGKLLVIVRRLFAIREHILEKNLTNAMNARKPLAEAKTL